MKKSVFLVLTAISVMVMSGCGSKESTETVKSARQLEREAYLRANNKTVDTSQATQAYSVIEEEKKANEQLWQEIEQTKTSNFNIGPIVWIVVSLVLVYALIGLLVVTVLSSSMFAYLGKMYGFLVYKLVEQESQLIETFGGKVLVISGDGWHAHPWWIKLTEIEFIKGMKISRFRMNTPITITGNTLVVEGLTEEYQVETVLSYGITIVDIVGHLRKLQMSKGTPPDLFFKTEQAIQEAIKAIMVEHNDGGIKTYPPDTTKNIARNDVPLLIKMDPTFRGGNIYDFMDALEKAVDDKYDTFDVNLSFEQLNPTKETVSYLKSLRARTMTATSATQLVRDLIKDGVPAEKAAEIAKSLALGGGGNSPLNITNN